MRIYEAKIQYDLVSIGEVETLSDPESVVDYMKGAYEQNPTQESFWVIALDRKNKPMGRSLVTLGTASSCLVHPREVFKYAILQSASAIIVSHNHPSGDPAPSREDIRVTKQLREASYVLGIELLDHIIIGTPEDDPLRVGYYSFQEGGFL
jgi:DNA repair protein RadC